MPCRNTVAGLQEIPTAIFCKNSNTTSTQPQTGSGKDGLPQTRIGIGIKRRHCLSLTPQHETLKKVWGSDGEGTHGADA